MCYCGEYLLCLFVFIVCVFFFFKQKTAYEMRISDWSSDVCSSDLSHSLRPRQWAVRALPSPAWSARIPLGRRTVVGHGSSAMARRARKADPGRGARPRGDRPHHAGQYRMRQSVAWGKRVSVRVAHGGRRIIKQQTNTTTKPKK